MNNDQKVTDRKLLSLIDRMEKCPVFIPPTETRLPEPREERDFLMIRRIYEYDWMLTDDQIKKLVDIPDASFDQRMRRLVYHGYIHKLVKWKRDQFNFGVYWLAERGARYIAGLAGEENNWREYCFKASRKWPKVRHPRLSQIIHDARINDYRLAVEFNCQADPHLELRQWVTERAFSTHADRVTYRNRKGHQDSRNFIPDGFYMIDDTANRSLYRFLFELDNGVKDGQKMLDEKLLIGAAYVESNLYRDRFDTIHQAWYTFVCLDWQRIGQLKRDIEKHRPRQAYLFYFTTLEQVQTVNDFLTSPIWAQGGKSELVSLIGSDT